MKLLKRLRVPVCQEPVLFFIYQETARFLVYKNPPGDCTVASRKMMLPQLAAGEESRKQDSFLSTIFNFEYPSI